MTQVITRDNNDEAKLARIEIDRLYVSKMNVRKDIGEISDLAASLKKQGVIEPLLVRPKGSKYEVICGNRRLAAAKKAGLKTIPCVVDYNISDAKSLIASVTENIHRSSLTADEIALGYHTFKHFEPESTMTQFAQMLNMSQPWVGQCINAFNAAVKLQQAGYKISIRPREGERGEREKDGTTLLPVRHLAKIESTISELESKKVITAEEGMQKRAELAKASKDLDIYEVDDFVSKFGKEPQKPVQEIKKESVTVKKVKEALDDPAAREILLEDKKLVDEAYHRKATEAEHFWDSHKIEPKVGERSITDDAWFSIRSSIFKLIADMQIKSGKENRTANAKTEHLRERGWINVFKHREQKEIDEFLHDYLEPVMGEFKLIKEIGENELEQRKKDLR